jgi:hypothetical protein
LEISASDDGIMFTINQYTDPNRKGEGITVQTSHILKGNTWQHFTVAYDGTTDANGVGIYLNGQPLELDIIRNNLKRNSASTNSFLVGRRVLKEGFRSNPQGLFRARLDELMLFNRRLSGHEVADLANFNPIQQLQAIPEKSDHQMKRLVFQQLHHQDPSYQQLTRILSEYKYREMKTEHLVLKPTMVMREMDTLRPAFILDRGLYSAPTERVYPATPEHIMSFSGNLPQNRLDWGWWLGFCCSKAAVLTPSNFNPGPC